MEGGSRIVEYITYVIIAIVIFAMVYFLGRTLKMVLGFLTLNFADAMHRWGPTRRWFARRQERKQDNNGAGPDKDR